MVDKQLCDLPLGKHLCEEFRGKARAVFWLFEIQVQEAPDVVKTPVEVFKWN